MTMVTETQPSAPALSEIGDGRFLDHLSSAADMVTARRFREGEVEILRALSISPSDVRALKLLALVRFKLGRWEEARTVCRELASAMPRDAGIRLKLGLIALKLDRVDESARELELSARLAPDDPRAWSYLGFAYARRGEPVRAAAAFRRAGQDARAMEVERSADRVASAAPVVAAVLPSPSLPSQSPSPLGSIPAAVFEPLVDSSQPIDAREPRTDPDRFRTSSSIGTGAVPVSPLLAYAVSRLAPPADQPAWVGATLRLAIGDEIFVRGDAAVACSGTARWEPTNRRVQGRTTAEQLGGGATEAGRFCRLTGPGDVFVAAPAGRLVPLRLEGDILYVREDRVLAFEGTVSWEYGHVPLADVAMVQFRGRGLVAIRVDGEPGAVRVTPERGAFVSAPHLLGWIGHVVASGTRETAADGQDWQQEGGRGPAGPFGLACEGEGIVLLDVRGPERSRDRPGESP